MELMEKYQFTVDGSIVQNPEGWKDFQLRLKRDDDIAGLLVSSTNRFIFKRDGYDILFDRFESNYSDKVKVSIDILQEDNTYLEQYEGVVILTDVLFNLEKRTAEATVEDASFQGAIQGNKNIKTFINSGLTKNGVLVSTPSIFNLDYFNASGTYQGLLNRRAYLVKEVLDFLVRFMTDDEVKGIQSDYLDDVSNWEGVLPYITTGINIRLASQEAPNISFSQLITFLQRTHDLTFDFVTNSNGDPVMRIEEKEFFFQGQSIDTIRNIEDLRVKVDAERVFSHLEIGNNTSRTNGNCSVTTRFFTFKKEDYMFRGKGNIDKLLDLTTDFVTDNNAITSQAIGGRDFDDDVIVVLGILDGTQAALFTDPAYCSNSPIYNLGFTNDRIIDRQISSIPNSVAKYLSASTTPSKAELVAPIFGDFGALIAQLTIPVDRGLDVDMTEGIYDLGSNYNQIANPRTYYDVPFAGDFSFEAGVRLGFVLKSVFSAQSYTSSVNFTISLQRWDSTFTTLKETITSPASVFGFSFPFPVDGFKAAARVISGTMACATGDRVLVRLGLVLTQARNTADINFSVDVSPDTFFTCLGAADDAGTFKVFDPNSFRARQYTFEKNLSLTRTDNIRANTRNSIVINELSDTALDKQVWIEEMVNNIEKGTTSFVTIK